MQWNTKITSARRTCVVAIKIRNGSIFGRGSDPQVRLNGVAQPVILLHDGNWHFPYWEHQPKKTDLIEIAQSGQDFQPVPLDEFFDQRDILRDLTIVAPCEVNSFSFAGNTTNIFGTYTPVNPDFSVRLNGVPPKGLTFCVPEVEDAIQRNAIGITTTRQVRISLRLLTKRRFFRSIPPLKTISTFRFLTGRPILMFVS